MLLIIAGSVVITLLVRVRASQEDLLRQLSLLRQAVMFERTAGGKETRAPAGPSAVDILKTSPQKKQTQPQPQRPVTPVEPAASPAIPETPIHEGKEIPKEPPKTVQPPPLPSFIPIPPAPCPSAFEKGVKEAIGKIWSWIVVGEEHRPKNVTMEYAVASTWLLRAGIIILVTAIGFLLKYSIENSWIGPLGRVTLSFLAGVAMLAFGLRLTGRRYHVIGLGLLGGGVATLYFSAFASFAMYHLLYAIRRSP